MRGGDGENGAKGYSGAHGNRVHKNLMILTEYRHNICGHGDSHNYPNYEISWQQAIDVDANRSGINPIFRLWQHAIEHGYHHGYWWNTLMNKPCSNPNLDHPCAQSRVVRAKIAKFFSTFMDGDYLRINGTRGGNGADGGDGGNTGNVYFMGFPQDQLDYSLVSVPGYAGIGGEGGRPGRYGSGNGADGKNGSRGRHGKIYYNSGEIK